MTIQAKYPSLHIEARVNTMHIPTKPAALRVLTTDGASSGRLSPQWRDSWLVMNIILCQHHTGCRLCETRSSSVRAHWIEPSLVPADLVLSTLLCR
jgi:hypothetical protein